MRYIAILGPASAGFIWLLTNALERKEALTAGTISVIILLLLGAIYALAVGYNFRYITLELAKLEAILGIREAMLSAWPRSREEFLDRYRLGKVPWCTPPEMIKVFWQLCLVGIVIVLITVFAYKPRALALWPTLLVGIGALFFGCLAPIWFGLKLRGKVQEEPSTWDNVLNIPRSES